MRYLIFTLLLYIKPIIFCQNPYVFSATKYAGTDLILTKLDVFTGNTLSLNDASLFVGVVASNTIENTVLTWAYNSSKGGMALYNENGNLVNYFGYVIGCTVFNSLDGYYYGIYQLNPNKYFVKFDPTTGEFNTLSILPKVNEFFTYNN